MVKNGVVEWVVSLADNEQAQTTREMYPEHQIVNKIGEEGVGWLFDGVSFSPPVV